MLEDDDECIPVLNNLTLVRQALSDFGKAELYDKVLSLEPDNAWARDARRDIKDMGRGWNNLLSKGLLWMALKSSLQVLVVGLLVG